MVVFLRDSVARGVFWGGAPGVCARGPAFPPGPGRGGPPPPPPPPTPAGAAGPGVAPLWTSAVLRYCRLQRRHFARSNGPGVRVSALNRVATHLVDVVEQRFAIARRDVQHRPICCQLVSDRLREVPLLRLNRHRQIALWQQFFRNERN